MANTIRIKRSSTASNVPTAGELLEGELAINTNPADRKLYSKDSGGTVFEIAPEYSHPTHPGDDFSVDTGPLTGATVVSDIDINVTTDTLGHVTDANGVVSTRTITLDDIDVNSVKKDETEVITGVWTFDAAVTTSDYGTGGRVKDGTDVSRPMGFNVMPVYEIDANDTFDLAHNGMLWHKDLNAAVTFSCPNDTTIPVGATYVVHNDDTESLTISPNTGVTLYWLEAGAAPSSGSFTIAQGGIVTVYKYTDTEWWAWGSKEAGGGASLSGLSDTDITSPADASFLIYDTASGDWRDFVLSGDVSCTDGGVVTVNNDSHTHDVDNLTGVTSIASTWAFTATKMTHNTIFLNERASATTDVAGDGQIWVKNNIPNDLYFTGDTGIDYPVAYATYRRSSANVLDNANQTLNMTTDSVADALVNGCWYSDNATAYTLTLEPSTDTEFPVGAQMTVWNEGSGTLTINEGSGTTLYVMTGSARTDSAGGCTLGTGGYATIIRKSTTVYLIMGAGITP